MNIIYIKNMQNEKIVNFLGITIYKKIKTGTTIKRKYLFGIFKTKSEENGTKKYYLLGIQLLKMENKLPINSIEESLKNILTSKDFLYRKYAIEESRNALIIQNQHQKIFPQFKNINKGKAVAIVGAAPSLQYYSPMNDVIHIALNRVFVFDRIKFDYIFSVDYKGIKDYIKEFLEYKCIKFCGQYINSPVATDMKIPEYIMENENVYRFYSDHKYHKIDTQIYQDISIAPLMDFYSIAFCALHFAFWTHPKVIYIVGCDCCANGYFDNTKQRESDKVLNFTFSCVLDGYKKVKEFRDAHYPDVEIISVNPVGLRGMFRDVYTQSYLDANPEIKEELGNFVEILDENMELV